MSDMIFGTYTDEHGNIFVRVSQDVQVLTLEEADRIEAEYKRMQAENAKLRELVEVGLRCCDHKCDGCKFLRCGLCHVDEFEDEARKLGVEVAE